MLLILVGLRLPLAAALFLVGLGGTLLVTGNPRMMDSQLKSFTFGTLNTYSLSIIPLFLLMSEFAARGARVVLSGHSHGTQVDLPFLRDLGPSHPGLRVELGGATLVVSRGLGVIGAPLRVGVPAEVVVLRLHGGAGPVASDNVTSDHVAGEAVASGPAASGGAAGRASAPPGR